MLYVSKVINPNSVYRRCYGVVDTEDYTETICTCDVLEKLILKLDTSGEPCIEGTEIDPGSGGERLPRAYLYSGPGQIERSKLKVSKKCMRGSRQCSGVCMGEGCWHNGCEVRVSKAEVSGPRYYISKIWGSSGRVGVVDTVRREERRMYREEIEDLLQASFERAGGSVKEMDFDIWGVDFEYTRRGVKHVQFTVHTGYGVISPDELTPVKTWRWPWE